MIDKDTDQHPLECEELASRAAGEMKTFLLPLVAQYGWQEKIVTNLYNPDEQRAYTQVDIVGPESTQGQLWRVLPRLNRIASGYSGIILENNIIAGPVNQSPGDPDLYGLPVGKNEVSLYAAFAFAQ